MKYAQNAAVVFLVDGTIDDVDVVDGTINERLRRAVLYYSSGGPWMGYDSKK